MRDSAAIRTSDEMPFDVFLTDNLRKKHAPVFMCKEKQKLMNNGMKRTKIAIFAKISEETIMVIITLQRKKCIGCNYCVELAPGQFQMSKKDGKSVLLHSEEKKGFFTIKSPDDNIFDNAEKAREACPVKIISVKQG